MMFKIGWFEINLIYWFMCFLLRNLGIIVYSYGLIKICYVSICVWIENVRVWNILIWYIDSWLKL